ncbi:MAG: 4Fe-4S dicluster domain-containing protein [Desulfarculus sp.]|nr:4Fe-4S dicluster domain-containing protein [Desulfarculus sp.]
MVKKKLVISFPPRLIQEPVTYHLIRDYDLQVNILRATVRPRERGRMVVEIKGDKKNLDRAFEYMESVGLQVDPLVQEMRYYPERCVHCTACTAVCPTEALTVDPSSRELVFDASHCIICESCIPACSYAAIESQF